MPLFALKKLLAVSIAAKNARGVPILKRVKLFNVPTREDVTNKLGA